MLNLIYTPYSGGIDLMQEAKGSYLELKKGYVIQENDR